MEQFTTTMYFTVTGKDGAKKQYECRGYEETAQSYELVLTSGERVSFRKSDIKSCVCTGFAPFWIA